MVSGAVTGQLDGELAIGGGDPHPAMHVKPRMRPGEHALPDEVVVIAGASSLDDSTQHQEAGLTVLQPLSDPEERGLVEDVGDRLPGGRGVARVLLDLAGPILDERPCRMGRWPERFPIV